jgi:ABC-type nitrate/sulfonate/bicarbonate transport system substrate-binding protein
MGLVALLLGMGWACDEAPPAAQPAPTEQAVPAPAEPGKLLRIGFFHGGRNMLVYRAWIDGWFDQAGLDVMLRTTHQTRSTEFHDMPRSVDELMQVKKNKSTRYIGRTTGTTIVGEMRKGGLDCGMIGESSFLLAVDEQLAFTAIAKLGQDARDEPGKIVVVRSDLDIRGPGDLIGRTIGSRESGPYDRVMTREWVLSRGLRLDQMQIIDQIPQHPLKKKLEMRKLDLAFLHLHIATDVVKRGLYKRYPGFVFDFADPALSQALLVCKNTVIAERRAELVRFIQVYKRRIDHEQSLSKELRGANRGDKTLGMDLRSFKGLNLPQYDPIPVIEVELLATMQGLMLKHGVVQEAKPVADMVDNTLVREALAGLPEPPLDAQ